MSLSPAMKQALDNANFITPTPIQEQAIPHALEGKDVLATAQTGTGKTLAFLIPVIEALNNGPKNTRGIEVLVLVPTRELAMQVVGEYDKLRTRAMKPAALVIGGLSENPQIQALRNGARLVVATPGRLEDFLDRRLADVRNVRTLILDEADRMLDMGFLPAIRRIVSALPRERQTLCFSATLEASVAGLVNDYMRNPIRVALGSVLKAADNVELQAFEVSNHTKQDMLRKLLLETKGRTLVFARTKRGTERLAKTLIRDGFNAAMIHGDRTQSQRTKALASFDAGHIDVLVATDVAARGLHINEVEHVINFDVPTLPEDFIHRVGRTGRAGATGIASTLVAGQDVADLRKIERTLKLKITRKPADLSGLPAQKSQNTLASRKITALPGECFA